MITFVLLVLGLLIMVASLDRPFKSRSAVVEPLRRRVGRSNLIPGDDIIGSTTEPALWTALDDYQLRRLLDS